MSSERTRTDDVDDGVKPSIGFGEVICFVIDDRISTDRVHEIDVFCTTNCGYGSSKYFFVIVSTILSEAIEGFTIFNAFPINLRIPIGKE